jgi:hypothetical protein
MSRFTVNIPIPMFGNARQGAAPSYVIECDPAWHTRSADVLGEANGKPVEYRIVTDGQGHWTLDGKSLPHLAGAI